MQKFHDIVYKYANFLDQAKKIINQEGKITMANFLKKKINAYSLFIKNMNY